MNINLFLCLLLICLLDPGRAAADPFTQFLIATFAMSQATAAFIVRIGISLALSALQTVLQSKPDQPRRPGIKTESTTSGGTNPQTTILGRYATAGNMVAPIYSHPNEGSLPNKFLTYVVDFGDLPGVTLSRVIVAGEYVTDLQEASEGDHDMEGMFVDGVPHMFLTWHDGTQTEADAYMMANYADHPDRPWSEDMVGTGVPYAVITFLYNRELFNNLPGVRFELDGIPLYDPRLDSTVGGSGAHRWDDPATWAQTNNPQVMNYNILRGITFPDGQIWGGEAAAEDLPLDSWFAAMNECDLPVTLKNGGTQPQYRAGFEVSFDQTPASVVDEFNKASSAEISEFGGVYKIRVGAPALPVYFFSDDDIVEDAAQSLTPYPGLDAVHNAVHATYPSPNALWETRDAPPRYNDAWEVEDGGRQLVADVDLPAAPYGRQVQRLMKAWILDERRFRRHALTLPPDAAILEPLDSAAWTSAGEGYTSKVFEIAEISDDLTTLLQTVQIRERDASDFSWIPVADEQDLDHPSTAVTKPAKRILPGFDLVAVTLADGTAARRPALRLVWTGADLADSDAVEYEVELAADQSDVAAGVVSDATRGRKTIRGGILPATQYRAKARVIAGKRGAWSAWQTVQTDDIRIKAEDLSDEVNAAIATGSADGLTQTDLDALRDGFEGTLADLQVDATAAQQAALDSDAAKLAAQAARDDAEDAATTASGAASAAAGSAGAALASENAAGSSASAADADRVAAQTARSEAQAARDLAVSAKDSAEGAEAAAVDARDLAVSAQGGAEAARAGAQAAETLAAQAKSDAESASATAVSARDLAVSVGYDAERAAMRLLPNDFQEDGRFWQSSAVGVPGAGSVTGWLFKDVTGEGRVAYVPATAGVQWLLTAGAFRPVIGRTYRVTVRSRNAGTVNGTPQISAFFRSLDENYNNAQAQAFTSFTQTASYADYVAEWTCTTAHAWARAGMYSRDDLTGSGEIRVQSITVEDVTKEKAASDAAAAAAISESAAVNAKNSAEDASAAAAFSRDVAAKVGNGGGCLNPIFAEWPGGYNQVSNGDGGNWVGFSEGVGKYGNSWTYYNGTSLATNHPHLIRNCTASADNALAASQAEYVEIDFEVEMISGKWGSARVDVQWHGAAFYSESIWLSEYLSNNNGKIQRLTAIVKKPDNFSIGSGPDELRIVYYGNVADGPHACIEHEARIHRFDYRVLNGAAQALIQQQAIADLEGNAAASLVFKATSTSGGVASVEVVSGGNPNGGSNKIAMTGDEIEFDGLGVFKNGLEGGNYQENVQGFRLDSSGLYLPNGIIRSYIQDKAVSDGAYVGTGGTRLVANDLGNTQVEYLSLGNINNQGYWHFCFTCEARGETAPVNSATGVYFQYRLDGGAWINAAAMSTGISSNWKEYEHIEHFYGNAQIELRIVVSPDANSQLLTQVNCRRSHLIGRSNALK